MADDILTSLQRITGYRRLDDNDLNAIREAIAEIETLRSNVASQALQTVLREIRYNAERKSLEKMSMGTFDHD